jgi:TatD DNase family protein
MAAPPVAPREAPFAPLVDTHAHLNDRRFVTDLAAAIARAQEAGVGAIVVVGYDLDSSRRAVRLAQEYDCVWSAVGIHPHVAKTADARALAELRRLAAQPRVVALGECGLDFYRDLSPRDVQQRVFEAQLDLARDVGLPVIVHCRDAMAPTMTTLAHYQVPIGGVMHCFDGSVEDARRAVDLGLHVSCAGTLTYRKDRVLSDAIATVSVDRLVVETDCPWLAPQGHRGGRNEPAFVRLVAQAAARVRGVSLDALARQTTDNAAALFRTPALAAPAERAGRALEVTV